MAPFSPVDALIGGALIGLSASLLVVALGRVAGVSGIMGGLLRPWGAESGWRIAFLVGFVAGPLLLGLLGFDLPSVTVSGSAPLLIAGGLLVGFGTRLGGGCTSGHGVCGLARLSPRSLAATAVFMVTAAAVVFVLRHGIGG
ncbi:MAG: YeeE/YedE family protein [Alphaproteobacteria bacterium]|nr:YeeE/YedE family protein [Alphaproteobacteria bacterium]